MNPLSPLPVPTPSPASSEPSLTPASLSALSNEEVEDGLHTWAGRVARALRALPETSAAFGTGRLSYTQVRAISRVATADDERQWIGYARHATGGQLERLVAGVRRATANLKRRKAVDVLMQPAVRWQHCERGGQPARSRGFRLHPRELSWANLHDFPIR